MLKTVNIFVQTVMDFFKIHWWIESSKEKHLFEIFNILFPDTFDPFNASLLNKSTFSVYTVKLKAKNKKHLNKCMLASCQITVKLAI